MILCHYGDLVVRFTTAIVHTSLLPVHMLEITQATGFTDRCITDSARWEFLPQLLEYYDHRRSVWQPTVDDSGVPEHHTLPPIGLT